jgi:hypothetical protein
VPSERLQGYLRYAILPIVSRSLDDAEKALKIMKEVFPTTFA